MKIKILYDKGLIRIKKKGEKAKLFKFPIVDRSRKFSLGLVKSLCEELFEEVVYIDANPEIYFILPNVEEFGVSTPYNILELLRKNKKVLKNVGIRAHKPNEILIKKYPILSKTSFWVDVYYRGNTCISTMVYWGKRKLNKEMKKAGLEATNLLIKAYAEAYDHEIVPRNREKIRDIIKKYFGVKEPVKIKKMPEIKAEKVQTKKIETIKKKIEKEVREVKETKPSKVSREISYEDIKKKIEEFMREETSSFFDRAVKIKVEQIKLKEKREKLNRILYEYICSKRDQEALKKFMFSINTEILKLKYKK